MEERIIEEYGSIEEAVRQEKERNRRLLQGTGLAEIIKNKSEGDEYETD